MGDDLIRPGVMVPKPFTVIMDRDEAPAYRCECCPEKTPFWKGEERQRDIHVKACSERYEAELRQHSMRVKAPGLFDPEVSGDVEYGKWVRQNKEAIIRGDKTM